MRELALPEREWSSEVLNEVLAELVDVGKESLVNSLLELDAVRVDSGLLSLRLGDELLGSLSISDLSLLEELVGEVGGSIDNSLGELNLGGSSNDLSSSDAADGDTVELVGASDEEEARRKLLEEDNARAAVLAGKEDEDLAGGDALAERGLVTAALQ